MTLGDIIKKYRTDNSVTMEYVAKLCGITKGYVAMLERNINSKTGKPVKPTLETILKVCNGLHLDVDLVFNELDDDYVFSVSPSQRTLFNSKGAQGMANKLSNPESRLLDSFRVLNQDGQDKVMEYADDLASSERYTVSDNVVAYKTPILNAAHERTDIEVTDEMRQHDEDIMDDENF